LCCRNHLKHLKETCHDEQNSADVTLSNADFEEALGIYLASSMSCCFTKETDTASTPAVICIYTYVYTLSVAQINNKLERIWEEVVIAQFEVLSQYFPGGVEKSCEKPQSGQPLSGPRFEPGIS
jgi:hypothetical protein